MKHPLKQSEMEEELEKKLDKMVKEMSTPALKPCSDKLVKFLDLASKAPGDIPRWFNDPAPFDEPTCPKDWDNWPDLTVQERKTCRSWKEDQTYDMEGDDYTENEIAFGRAWHRYWDECEAIRNLNLESRYFAWRIYYAKMLITTANAEKLPWE